MPPLVSLLAALCLMATPQQVKIYHPDPSPPARVVLPGPVEVPMLLENGLPILEVQVNGRGPYRFGIETGAGFVAVSPRLVEELKLERTGGPDESPAYRLESIVIGSARFEGIPVSPVGGVSGNIDGLLGLPLYSQILITLDYPARRVRFEQGALPEPDGATVLPISKAGPFCAVPLAVGDREFAAVIDTRSTGAVGLTPEAAESVRFEGELVQIGVARGAGIPETPVKAGKLAGDVRLGRYVFPQPQVGVRALPPGYPTNPLVGTVVLQHFVVTLDQAHQRVRFAREGPTTIQLPARNLSRAPAAKPADAAAPQPAAKPDAASLQAYVGTYGERTITLRDGVLQLQRADGPALEMVPAGPDAFTLARVPEARIGFARDATGAVVEIRVLNPQGQWESAKRTK